MTRRQLMARAQTKGTERRARVMLTSLLCLSAALVVPPASHAEGEVFELLSGSGSDADVTYRAISSDGKTAFFETVEPIAGTGDTDAAEDVYKSQNGSITLVSRGTPGMGASFVRASADLSRVFIVTAEPIAGTGDTDSAFDVYEVQEGLTTLISPGVSNNDVTGAATSPDGSRALFSTSEAIPGTGDADSGYDAYLAEGGNVTLVTGSGADLPADVRGFTPDLSRVFFETAEAMPGTGDVDATSDFYEVTAGAFTLLTGSGDLASLTFHGNSADGNRVFFDTTTAIPGTGDVDTRRDVYEAAGGAITLLSPGTEGATSAADATFRRSSADGSRVIFETAAAIPGTGDADAARDVYQAEAGTLTLLSGSGADTLAQFSRASTDGSRVIFSTDEPIAGTGDGDAARDFYEAEGGAITLLSGSGADTGVVSSPVITPDAGSVFFETTEPIAGTGDADTARDSYLARDGEITLVSDGSADIDAFLRTTSDDGGRVFFVTKEAIPGTGDADAGQDLYVRRPPDAAAAPPPDGPAGSLHGACNGRAATIAGTAGDDRLSGTSGPDVIRGLAGDDKIAGMGGNDVICGGSGDDKLIGGPGKDRLIGGQGSDKLIGGPGLDELFAGTPGTRGNRRGGVKDACPGTGDRKHGC